MSAEDYNECEKLFCGSWTISKNENVEEFLAATGMAEEMKAILRKENDFTVTRDGDCFVDKAKLGGVDVEIRMPINKEVEWKDKEENPMFHWKLMATFKDGVWTETTTPQNEAGGKTQVMKCYIEGGEFVAEFSLPDVPGVTAKRTFKKV